VPHLINFGVSTFVMAIRGQAGNIGTRKRLIEKNLDEGALGEFARLRRHCDGSGWLRFRQRCWRREW